MNYYLIFKNNFCVKTNFEFFNKTLKFLKFKEMRFDLYRNTFKCESVIYLELDSVDFYSYLEFIK